MAKDASGKPPQASHRTQAKAARLAREAAALRANLRKRKDQARAQAEDAGRVPPKSD